VTVALAHPNIALVKYWGKVDHARNLPATPSLSLTLGPWRTRTSVEWDRPEDQVVGAPPERVLRFLDEALPGRTACRVVTESDFPVAAGLASSASAFAALAVAVRPDLPPEALSELARRGSGSACRSVWGGFSTWEAGADRAVPLAGPDHWDVRVVVALAGEGPKAVSSREGMARTERTSPLYPGWVASARRDFEQACLDRLDVIAESGRAGDASSRWPAARWGTGTARCSARPWSGRPFACTPPCSAPSLR
jgi:diphosphomevalonate decarboxylase